MRLSLTLSFPPLLLCLTLPALAQSPGEFHLTGRAGLQGTPGFQEGGDVLLDFRRTGWIAGRSTIGGVDAAWITCPADGVSRRVGLFEGEGFEGGGSNILQLNDGGWAHGSSRAFLPDGTPSYVIWVAEGATGRTRRAGLTGAEHTATNGGQIGGVSEMTKSGFSWGLSYRYSGNTILTGGSVWVMDGRTGAVFPAGLSGGPEFTRATDLARNTEGGLLTESGWLAGVSARYVEQREAGGAAWVTSAVTGVTHAIGLFPQADFRDDSDIYGVSDNGEVTGTTFETLTGGGDLRVAWVADGATGVTRRIGLYEEEMYTYSPFGTQRSGVANVTKSGWVMGGSDIFRKETPIAGGRAAWVAEARTGATRRVGLFEGETFTRNGFSYSDTQFLTESGWVGGFSDLKDPASENTPPAVRGRAVWVARASTGETRRVGPAGRLSSELHGLSEDGWAWGSSGPLLEEGGSAPRGGAGPWVADAATGETRPVGLEGPEYTAPEGLTRGSVLAVLDGGKVLGTTRWWDIDLPVGVAAWVEDWATGTVKRIGLSGEMFDLPHETVVQGWTRSGFIRGTSHSRRLVGAFPIPWVADAATGVTRTVGFQPAEPVAAGPSEIRFLTEGGLAAGATLRLTDAGATAWVMDVKTGLQTDFELSVRASDGYSFSEIRGVTSAGIVYGVYTPVNNESYTGSRPFLWSAGWGTLVCGGTGEADSGVPFPGGVQVSDSGLVIVQRKAEGVPGKVILFGAPSGPGGAGGVRVTDLARTAEGAFRLSFFTDTAIKITLQSSADLSLWKDEQTADAAPGASSLETPADPAAPNKYWRLKTAPAAP